MNIRKENQPTTVPFAATPAGEPPTIREWANRYVWTDRMLTALETGVRRYPNAYFAEQRLYSLNAAHVRFCQSSLR